jgi:predicted ribosome quality control (RQC) complex YloA/Tae2 family protein
MSMTEAEIGRMVGAVAPGARGARIVRIDQPDAWSLAFELRRGAHRLWLLVSAEPGASRMHLAGRRPRTPGGASGLLQAVRARLTGAKVVDLLQQPCDRIVVLEAEGRDALMAAHRERLVCELTGLHANVVLVDEGGVVTACLRGSRRAARPLGPGREYRFPPAPPARPAQDRFARVPDEADALSRAVEAYYAAARKETETEARAESLRARIGREKSRLEKQVGELREALARSEAAEELRRDGELLRLQPDQHARAPSVLRVEDLFEAARPEREIRLDERLSIGENADRLFRRYKKRKAARGGLERRLAEAERSLEGLGPLEEAAGVERPDVAEIEAGLAALGLAPERETAPEAGRRAAAPGGPRRFRGAGGLEILVARNRRQNEQLTFRTARGNDIWLHLADWPGPHAIIRRPKGAEVSPEALVDAGHLLVHFSRIRGAGSADIIWTERKNVQRARGGKTGSVNYSAVRRLTVRLDPGRLRRLLGGKGVD